MVWVFSGIIFKRCRFESVPSGCGICSNLMSKGGEHIGRPFVAPKFEYFIGFNRFFYPTGVGILGASVPTGFKYSLD